MYHCCDFNIVLYNNDDGYTNKRSEVMAKKKKHFLQIHAINQIISIMSQ